MRNLIKRLIFRIISVFLSLMVIFLIGEILTRIFRDKPPALSKTTQKKAATLFEPNTSYKNSSSIDGEFEYTVSINQLGYRGGNFTKEKSAETLRIFAVGDSYIFGVGVDDDETIPSQLEAGLNKKGIKAEVINAGVGHSSPISHYLNLRDIHLQYKPDLVLLFLDMTDLWDDWHSERNAIFDSQGEIIRFDPAYINGKRDWWITAMSYSSFCRYLNDKVVRTVEKIRILGFTTYVKAKIEGKRAKAVIIQSRDKNSDKTITKFDAFLFLRGKESKHIIDQHWKRTSSYIKKIRDLLEKQDIPIVLVMYPHSIHVGADEWNEGRETWGFEVNKLYTDHYPFELVESFANQEGIPFINTLQHLLNAKKRDKKKLYYDWDGHLTPEGYRLVAEGVLQNYLQTLN